MPVACRNSGSLHEGVALLEIVTALICAIEDDQIIFMDVDFENEGEGKGWVGVHASQPVGIPRQHFNPDAIEDDHHDFDFEKMSKDIQYHAERLGKEVHYVAISTFGNVDNKTGNIIYRSWDRKRWDSELGSQFCVRAHLQKLWGDKAINVIIENDATAAVMGEYKYGQGDKKNSFAYVWMGRGVNIGIMLNGQSWKGKLHPEAGHILARRHKDDPLPKGECSSHDGCVEGLASIRSINRRIHEQKMDEKDVLEIVSEYYAQLCMSITMIAATERIVLGGYIIDRYSTLVDKIQRHYKKLVNGYPAYSEQQTAKAYIRKSTLSQTAALWGMVEATRQHLENPRHAKAQD